jgi:hypothetical protein
MGSFFSLKRFVEVTCCLFMIHLTACNRFNPQESAEARFAGEVIRLLRRYPSEVSPSPVTNLSQLFPLTKHGYPYLHHRELLQYGQYAGFTNSLTEKYNFFWPRFTHEYLTGDIICMSAPPFLGGDGLSRIYIGEKDGSYTFRSISETTLRRVLNELKTKCSFTEIDADAGTAS